MWKTKKELTGEVSEDTRSEGAVCVGCRQVSNAVREVVRGSKCVGGWCGQIDQ